MSIRNAILFRPDGKAAPLFLAQWRNKGPLAPIQSNAVLVDQDGLATPFFALLWRTAFPVRQDLPVGPSANPDGTGTDAFWDIFR